MTAEQKKPADDGLLWIIEEANKLVGMTPAHSDGTHAIVAAIIWAGERIARAIEERPI